MKITNKKLITLLIVGLVLPIPLQVFSHVVQSSALVSQIAYVISKILFVAVPLVFWLMTREPLMIPGGTKKRFAIASGVIFSLIIFSILQLGINFIRPHGISIYETLSALGLTKNFLLYSSFIIIVNSFLEEMYWRYSIFGGLKQITTNLAAMVISSLGFTAMHIMYFIGLFESVPAIVVLTIFTFAFGVFWAWLYEKTRSIPHVWINHMLVNIPIFYIEYLIISNF